MRFGWAPLCAAGLGLARLAHAQHETEPATPKADAVPSEVEEDEEQLETVVPSGAHDDSDGISIGHAPATRYGKMSAKSCLAEVKRRALPVVALGPLRGVPIPVRLTGPLHGVSVHSGIPASQRASSPYEVFDCRLALALDDFTQVLASHDVVELVHMSAYRPPPKRWPVDKPGKRHGAGLALDAAIFIKRDGSKLVVEKHFRGQRHANPCPTHVKASGRSAESKEIRGLFCEAREKGLFHVMLSPNFNYAHRNHFHLEVAANPRWFYVR